MPVTVFVSAFPPFPAVQLSCSPGQRIGTLLEELELKLPTLPTDNVRLWPISRPSASPDTTLADLCDGGNADMVSFSLTASLRGGKGGFGSQLRAAGGRMSSQKTSNNDSCRDLSGRRLSTVKEAKRLAEYLEHEPDRKKAAAEAQKAKLEALEKQLGIGPSQLSSKGKQPEEQAPVTVGTKRRLDDTAFVEESQALVDNVKSAVAAGLLRKKKKAKLETSEEQSAVPKTLTPAPQSVPATAAA